MKKIYVIIILLIAFVFSGICQVGIDTVKHGTKTIVIKTDLTDDEDIDLGRDCFSRCNKDYSKNCGTKCRSSENSSKRGITCKIKSLTLSNRILVLMPVILFLAAFFIFLLILRRENYKLSETLASGMPQIIKTTITKPDPADPAKTITETREETYFPKSMSKLAAFIAIVTAIIIAVCGITYHAYFSVKLCSPQPQFTGGWILVALLLIGLIPYTIKSMFKK